MTTEEIYDRMERAMLAALVEVLENDAEAEAVLKLALPYFVRAAEEGK